ncbi:hypothetical protein NUK34_07975 [Kerstersia gyiorum]|uniref:hypothetical protein n=1 Tax=Kerstersia gyiorum TaxID=206506 RepID=UPI00214F752C|nr:hypothetical protein [Kerstersia gyiorum]MCR4158788.1 hypothetical protein [Kerstersia gyiorum]
MSNCLRRAAPLLLGGAGGGVVAAIGISLYVTGTVFGASWWDALTALGTISAVIVALHGIASERAAYRQREIAASVRYGTTIFSVLSTFHLRLVALRAPYRQILIGNSHLSEKEFSEIKDALSTLSILDIEKLSVSYPVAASKLGFAITMLGQASFLHANDPHRNITVTVDSLLEKAVLALHAACSEIMSTNTPLECQGRN